MLLLDNVEHVCEADPWPWGGEPIFRNGTYAGLVTTTAFGFTLGQHVLLVNLVKKFLKAKVNSDFLYRDLYPTSAKRMTGLLLCNTLETGLTKLK